MNKTFTLRDLANIALGAAELTNEHLNVLQSLLVILMQKLNCHNESVRLHGFTAKCIQELLKETPKCHQYSFQLETVTRFQGKYKLLEELERKTQEIDLEMQKHLDKIRKCYKTFSYSPHKWDFRTSPTEDLCTIYMRHNREFCKLASNASFNKQILIRVLPLTLERFSAFESRIENMKNKLQRMEKHVGEIASELKAVQFIIYAIADVRCKLEQGSETFRIAMWETQEMLNCKLPRVALPALKIYLEHRFIDIRKHLRLLKIASEKNTITKPIIISDKKTCLSCDFDNHRQQFNKKYQTVVNEKQFACTNLLKDPSVTDKIHKIQISDYKMAAQDHSRLWHFF